MAITLSTGATLSVAKTYAAPLSFTVISNAANAVCTVVGSTIVAGDYVEVSSGWGLLDKRVVRAYTGSSATSLILEGVDTSNTSKYPIGTGIGSVRKVTAWSQLSQVKGVTATGGTQNFADITAIDDVVERQIPTTKTAVSMTAEVFDDPTLDWYTDVSAADAARTPYGLLMTFPNGSKLLANSYWSLLKVPTMGKNEALMSQITLSYAAEPIRYAT